MSNDPIAQEQVNELQKLVQKEKAYRDKLNVMEGKVQSSDYR